MEKGLELYGCAIVLKAGRKVSVMSNMNMEEISSRSGIGQKVQEILIAKTLSGEAIWESRGLVEKNDNYPTNVETYTTKYMGFDYQLRCEQGWPEHNGETRHYEFFSLICIDIFELEDAHALWSAVVDVDVWPDSFLVLQSLLA